MTSQKLLVVTGKGGVGKSAVAAAMALKSARAGYRTLLVELGEPSYFQYVFGKPPRYQGLAIEPRLLLSNWSGEACLREYVTHFVRLARVVDLFFENRVMKAFVRAAPALRELAILGKFTSGIRKWGPELPFDRIVMDAYATGHFLALLRAPLGMAELIEFGPMGEQSRRIHEVMVNPALCRHCVVTLPEELPTAETRELILTLRSEFGLDPKVLVNKWLQTSLTNKKLDELTRQNNWPAADLSDFLAYVGTKLRRQNECTGQLAEAGVTFSCLPLVFTPHAPEVIETLANEIEDPWTS